jgi:methionine synthase / methylenetetrahydrofolate reductase(NADPH)
LAAAEALAAAGVDAITIAENPLAVPRLSNIVLAGMVRARTGIDVVVHLTGRDRNLVGMQSTIMGLAASGLHNVLAVTGDPPSAGSAERVSGVYDLRSLELMRLLAGFNQGRNHYGDAMRLPVNFCIGGAFNPNTRNMALQVGRMEKKIEAGAGYFLTQPVYSRQRVDEIWPRRGTSPRPSCLASCPWPAAATPSSCTTSSRASRFHSKPANAWPAPGSAARKRAWTSPGSCLNTPGPISRGSTSFRPSTVTPWPWS